MRRARSRTSTSLLISIPEASDLLGIHPSTAYRSIAAGRFPLPVLRIGDALKVSREAVRQLGTQPPAEMALTAEPARTESVHCIVCGTPLSRDPR
jgi:excisionase family DNA binding protein